MRPIVLLCVLCGYLIVPAFAEDLVLVNGTIVDGTLKPRYSGSVRIRDGRIAEVGSFKPDAGETVMDVKGLIVGPGFIDLHSQSSVDFAKDPGAGPLIARGITTVGVGADGSGPYLVEQFMAPFDEKPPALNLASFVGHSTVRRQILGTDYKRAATADEIERMGELVKAGMLEGAFGFSSDLTEEAASFSTPEETLALAKAATRYGGTYVIVPRSESLKEIVEIVRGAKAVVHVSLKQPAPALLAEIDKARAQGVELSLDIYRHLETGAQLRSFLQHAWVVILPEQYAREPKAISLDRALRKMTGLPASRVGLRERGILKKGAPADVVVFDAAQPSTMKYVFVNGTMVVKDGQPTGARPGQALR